MPEPADLADAADDLDREPALALVLLDDRRDLGQHEVADRVAEQRVFGGQVEVHRPRAYHRSRTTVPVLAFRPCPSRTPSTRRSPSATGHRAGPCRAAAADAVGGSSNLRRALLLRLRHDGPSSPEDLAAALGVSRTGVLQQLRALEAAGLVSRQAVRHGVGRPRHLYDVTAAAQDLFPTNYDGLASGLLAAIRAIGGEDLVDGVFDERRRITATGSGSAWPSGSSPEARLARPGPRAGGHPGRAGLPRRGHDRRGRRRSGWSSTTARSIASPPTTAPPARPSSSCSARSSAPTSSARRTSPRRPLLHVPDRQRERASGLFALHDLARRGLAAAAPARPRRSGTNDAASDVAAACSWSVDRQDPEPAELGQLVADVGLEHLRAVGVDREPDLVAPERVEDPAELVPARDDPGVEVGGRADLEDDARARGSSPSPAGRRRP